MHCRPVVLYSVLLSFLLAGPAARAEDAATAAFNECFTPKLEELKSLCQGFANQEAAKSANPGVATDSGVPSSGLFQECLNNSSPRIRRECQARAKEVADVNPTLSAPDSVTENCRPEPGKPCPPSTAPLPPRRPTGLGTPPKTAPVPTPRPKPAKQTPPQTQRRTPSQTDRNNAQARTSSQNTVVQPPSTAGADASSDIALCENSYALASRCCGNPAACVNELSYQDQANYAQLNQLMNQGPQAGGLTDYCQQLQSLGGAGGGVNGSLAGVCNSKQLSCNSICSQLANKYLTLMSGCSGCSSQDIYQSAYQQLSSRTSGCQQFASRVNQIANQAATGAGAGGYAAACNQIAASNPQAGMPMPTPNVSSSAAALAPGTSSDPYGCAENPSSQACQSCSANPNTPACRALNYKEASGTAQFAGNDDPLAGKANGSGFDIPDAPTGGTERVLNTAFESKPSKNGTVANNTGGGIPGTDGAQPASLGGRNAGPSPGSPGYTTDIMQGTQGAGGYSNPVYPNNGGSDGGNGAYGGSGRNVASSDDQSGMIGLDLRQFLPGGSRDPQRRLAGLGARSQINAKEEDIWRRISSKMEEKCKLGVLIGCR